MMINLIGQRFGRLVVLEIVDKNKWGNCRWLCLCDCGQKIIGQSGNLRSGHTGSCGCSHIKHGHNKRRKKSDTYRSWSSIIQRCTNINCAEYKHYGDRRIIVCKRWLKFKNFLEDMGKRPVGKSIDRINNSGGYCKDNCRWATQKQQMENTRRNNLKTLNGKTQCISSWSEETGIPDNTLRARFRYGWSIKRALTESVQRRKI